MLSMAISKIQTKTLHDLEFHRVIEQVQAYGVTELGKESIGQITPYRSREEIEKSLAETSEYVSSFTNENTIPGHYFESIHQELKLLKIENTSLEIQGFKRILVLCDHLNTHLKFFKKFKTYYPTLQSHTADYALQKEIPEAINRVLDKYGEVKDDASVDLQQIRIDMSGLKEKINKSFNAALSQYGGSDFLDEIRESVVDNRRVLAVKSMYRKRVKGAVMGSSKTGSIVFIEPEASLQHSRLLGNLLYEEQEEILKILRWLTDQIRPFQDLLVAYQDYLVFIDKTAAKAKYAESIGGILPKFSSTQQLDFKKAYHPLLLLSNKKTQTPTYPQDIVLEENNRIIVISGPNAGGKSITLKTIGLLQVMLQSGLLIPVHERSKACVFDKILTDIGDNQSIENHLSTYSYRLKNMNQFLQKCNKNTLFLIDEFGTGSDPELGGALAETFLETFYERGSYGVITTHYANLKMLANDLESASNANMLFDPKSLAPTFQLVLGEAGSSFTFEVAQKNGIPYSLINRAKKKIEKGKVRFDATIAKLQKERSQMRETGSKLKDEELKAREESLRLEKMNEKMKLKLNNYQELYDYHQKMIQLGSKLDELSEQYFVDKNKRQLVSNLLRVVETENSKRKKEKPQERKEKKEKKIAVTQQVVEEIKEIRVEKKKKAEKAKKEALKPKPKPVFKIGDRVRLIDGKAVGSIDSIEKNKAIINYGMFTTHADLSALDLVERSK